MYSFDKRVAAIIGSGFVLAWLMATPPIVTADEWNLATRFTINQPFEVPGAVLEANTPYVIRLHDSPSERHVVQVYNDDESKLLTMFMAISDERMEPADKTQFTFMETEPGYPVPVKEWFYPGRLNGLEFIYPEDQMAKIATHLKGAAGATTQTAAVAPAPQPEQVEPEPTPLAEEESTEIAQADLGESEIQREKPTEESTEPVAEEPPNTAPAAEESARELPRTAGELPLVGLIGLLCLGGALGLKVLNSNN